MACFFVKRSPARFRSDAQPSAPSDARAAATPVCACGTNGTQPRRRSSRPPTQRAFLCHNGTVCHSSSDSFPFLLMRLGCAAGLPFMRASIDNFRRAWYTFPRNNSGAQGSEVRFLHGHAAVFGEKRPTPPLSNREGGTVSFEPSVERLGRRRIDSVVT